MCEVIDLQEFKDKRRAAAMAKAMVMQLLDDDIVAVLPTSIDYSVMRPDGYRVIQINEPATSVEPPCDV